MSKRYFTRSYVGLILIVILALFVTPHIGMANVLSDNVQPAIDEVITSTLVLPAVQVAKPIYVFQCKPLPLDTSDHPGLAYAVYMQGSKVQQVHNDNIVAAAPIIIATTVEYYETYVATSSDIAQVATYTKQSIGLSASTVYDNYDFYTDYGLYGAGSVSWRSGFPTEDLDNLWVSNSLMIGRSGEIYRTLNPGNLIRRL